MLHLFTLFSLLLCFICYFIFQKESKTGSFRFLAFFLLGSGLLLRMILSVKVFGHGSDIIYFSDWAALMLEHGPSGFYTDEFLTDYPPLYMYVLYIIGRTRAHFHILQFTTQDLFLLKLPSICCDILCSLLIYCEAHKFAKWSELQSVCLMSAYLFHPAVIVDSACWGQVDSILTLEVILLCIFLKNAWLIPAYAIYGIGILTKPQMVIFTPVLLIGILDYVFMKNFTWKKFFCHLCSGLCVIAGMILLSLPFGLDKVLSQYVSTLDSYTFATMNAFNFWGMVGMNGIDQSTGFLFLPARAWGSLAIILIVVFTFIIAKYCQNTPYKYYMLGAFGILTMFTFSVRMHERYISPGIALLVLLLIYKPIKQLWICYSGLAALVYYNIEWVLEDYGDFEFHNDILLPRLAAAGIVGFVIYFYYIIKKYCLCNTSS